MRVETIKEVHQQTLVVNDVLEIELCQEEDGPVAIRLIPRYTNKVLFIVHDFQGNELSILLEKANQAVLERLMNPSPNVPF